MPSVSVRLFKGYDDFGNRLGSWGVPEVRRVRVHDGIGPTSDSVSANCAGVLPSGFVPTHIEVDFGGRRFVREVVDNGIEFEPSGFTVKGKGIAEASELLTRVRVDLSGGLNNVLRVPRFGSLNDLAVARGTSLGELVLYDLKDVRVSVGAVMRVLAEWSLGLRLGPGVVGVCDVSHDACAFMGHGEREFRRIGRCFAGACGESFVAWDLYRRGGCVHVASWRRGAWVGRFGAERQSFQVRGVVIVAADVGFSWERGAGV